MTDRIIIPSAAEVDARQEKTTYAEAQDQRAQIRDALAQAIESGSRLRSISIKGELFPAVTRELVSLGYACSYQNYERIPGKTTIIW